MLTRAPDAESARGNGVLAALREHSPLLALLALYFLARLVWTAGDWPLDRGLVESYAMLFGLMALLSFVGLLIFHAFAVTHRRPGTRAAFRLGTWAAFVREYLSLRRLTSVFLTWGLLTVLMPLFIHWKADIGASVPFRWDEAFMRLDRVLHLGRHPWEWLHPILGRPAVTGALDTLYHPVWTVGVMLLIAPLISWSSKRALAIRFLLSYVLVWVVVGTAFAYLFASAGPVYYAHLATPSGDPYRALLEYLAAVDAESGLFAVTAGAVMWTELADGSWPRIGIAAMPSVHVGLTFLVVFPAFHIHRILGALALVYVGVMLLGSVHLGWHYAIDGYLAILLTALIWWVTGVFLDRFWPKEVSNPQSRISQRPELPAR